jgi:hypothetical protein
MSRRKTAVEIADQQKKTKEVAEELAFELTAGGQMTGPHVPEVITQKTELPVEPSLSTIKVVRDLQREWRVCDDDWAEKLMVHYADPNERRSPFTVTLLIPGEPMVIGFDTPEETQEDTVFDDIKYEAGRIWKAWKESKSYEVPVVVDAEQAQEDAERTAAAEAAKRAMDERSTLKTMDRRQMLIPAGMPRELTVNSMSWTITPGQVCEVPEAFVILIEEWEKAQEAHSRLHGQYTHVGTSGDVSYINQNVGLPSSSSFKPPL